MKREIPLLFSFLVAASVFGQSPDELAGRWEWSASCESGETREGGFSLRRVAAESFWGEFPDSGNKSDVIRRGIFAETLRSFEFQRDYVTPAGEQGIERWSGKLSVSDGKLTWTGTLLDAETECSFEAVHQ